MKYSISALLLLLFVTNECKVFSQRNINREKTSFQTSEQWKPKTDVRADIAMVYGIGGNPSDKKKVKVSFEERVKSWREKGYIVQFMTGIAWGEYQDYFSGEWDGKTHFDEGQVEMNGDTIWHGHLVPYIVPTDNYLKYIKEKHIKRVIDAGISVIYLEEPEFWARAGYSAAFKNEWKKYYGNEWKDQHLSPENTYLSNKLKYHLYYHALNEVFSFAKAYGKTKGMDIKCFVPTHSLLNYSQWQIVSPEASLASLSSVDGYIAQVWTGTAREPNFYNGVKKERVFENAYMEYGCMASMTAPTKRKIYFLTDPIEDLPRDWEDYRKNYQATFTAQLLYPQINNYEVMPWPDRIYEGLYSVSKGSSQKAPIPEKYATQMQVMINTLNQMPISENTICGSKGISALMSNSLMFQRYPNHNSYEDPQLSNFLGQVMPFLKKGVPINVVHIENLKFSSALKYTKILLMSYSNMKPLDSNAHHLLAQWVKSGGVIIYSGSDNDPYQKVQEWWNTGNYNYSSPSEHLFELMKIFNTKSRNGLFHYGRGAVYIIREDPKNYVMSINGDRVYVRIVSNLYRQYVHKNILFKNFFSLKRGPYLILSVMDENKIKTPYIVNGKFIDLFDPRLPVINSKELRPGNQSLLFDLKDIHNENRAQVLASASRIYDEKRKAKTFEFITKSPVNTINVMRVLLPNKLQRCSVLCTNGLTVKNLKWNWDEASKTVFISFENDANGINVKLEW